MMSAAGGAAKAGLKLVSKGFASKGAEAVGKGMKSLGDNSRDFLAASMAMEEVGKAFGVSGPAMGLVAAQFQSATMGARLELMMGLMDLIQSDGGQQALDNIVKFANNLFGVGTDIVEVLTWLGNSTAIATFRTSIGNVLDDIEAIYQWIRKVMGLKEEIPAEEPENVTKFNWWAQERAQAQQDAAAAFAAANDWFSKMAAAIGGWGSAVGTAGGSFGQY